MRLDQSESPAERAGHLLSLVALLGAADVVSFLATRRREIFKASAARARGSIASLLLWTGLAVTSELARRRPGIRGLGRAATALALTCGAGNLALLAVHLRIGKGRARSLLGGALGAAALRSGLHRLRVR